MADKLPPNYDRYVRVHIVGKDDVLLDSFKVFVPPGDTKEHVSNDIVQRLGQHYNVE